MKNKFYITANRIWVCSRCSEVLLTSGLLAPLGNWETLVWVCDTSFQCKSLYCKINSNIIKQGVFLSCLCWVVKSFCFQRNSALQKMCSKFSNQPSTGAKSSPDLTPCSDLKWSLSLRYPAVHQSRRHFTLSSFPEDVHCGVETFSSQECISILEKYLTFCNARISLTDISIYWDMIDNIH